MPESLSQQIDRLQEVYFSERDPTGRAFVPLADLHRRMGELDRALELLTEGLEANPDFASGHVVEGQLLLDRGEADRAVRSFEKVLDLDPDNRVALRFLAELVPVDRALVHAERLIELDPEDGEARNRVDSLRARVVEPVESRAEKVALDEAVVEGAGRGLGMEEPAGDSPPPPPEPAAPPPEPEDEGPFSGADEIHTQTLAELYAKQGAVDKSVEMYRKLLERDPDNAMLRHRLRELTGGGRGVEEASVVPIDGLAPDEAAESTVVRPIVPIASLAPDTDPTGAVAGPDDSRPLVSIGDLAPDPEVATAAWTDAPPTTEGSDGDRIPPTREARPVVPIASLAPDASDETPDDPFPWINEI